ncbi:MAG: trypsin-like peptidase domain-containing protein [Elusimicrobia bacterium]|nr:trypsin-like peptidase domain-containing protein [Elusimicrobiota bacterium]
MRIDARSITTTALGIVVLSASFAAAAPRSQSRRANIRPQVIYGLDDRLDIWQVKDAKLLSLADSTVALFRGTSLTADASGQSMGLPTTTFQAGANMCKEEPFSDQPIGAFCSGSLVAPDIIMTAGHCIVSQDACNTTKFVFGYNVKAERAYPTSVPAGEVYSCKELLGREQVGNGADWALVKVDRPVTNHKPLAVNRAGTIEVGTPLVVIGHPAGLPTKVAGNSKVRKADGTGFFVANLDTYGGNSGSAVFNATSGLVEGILVRGENDYVYQGSCRVSNRCPDDGCRGEDVTKISALFDRIPKAGLEGTKVVNVSPAMQELLEVEKVSLK